MAGTAIRENFRHLFIIVCSLTVGVSFMAVSATAYSSRGTFIVDRTPPEIIVQTPGAGRVFSTAHPVEFAFSSRDKFDSAPKLAAELRGPNGKKINLESGRRMTFQDSERGRWRLVLVAEDDAENRTAEKEIAFDISDVTYDSASVRFRFYPSDTSGFVTIPESLLSFEIKDSAELPFIDFKIDTAEYTVYVSPVPVGPIVGASGETGLGFGQHTLSYRVGGRSGDSEVNVPFIVSPALVVEKTLSHAPRVLFWNNGATDSAFETRLSQFAVLFDTVASRRAFKEMLRSNRHNCYVIIGDKEQLDPEAVAELSEHVFSGAGLISNDPNYWGPDNGRSELSANLFMSRVAGSIRDEMFIELPNETPAVIFRVNQIQRIDTTNAVVIASANPADTERTETYPVAVRASYGLGKSLFLAFDPRPEIAEYILTLVKPTSERPVSGGLAFSSILIKSIVVPLDLAVRIDDVLPSDLEVISVVGPAQPSGRSLSWTILLPPGSDTIIGFVAKLPDGSDIVHTEATVSYEVGGIYHEFAHYPLEIRLIEYDSELAAIVDEVADLADGSPRAVQANLNKVIRNIESAKNVALSIDGKEAAIRNLLMAIEDLSKADISWETKASLRVRLDGALRYIEARQ